MRGLAGGKLCRYAMNDCQIILYAASDPAHRFDRRGCSVRFDDISDAEGSGADVTRCQSKRGAEMTVERLLLTAKGGMRYALKTSNRHGSTYIILFLAS